MVLDTENAFKKWLKKEIELMEGSTENWSSTKMEIQFLAEFKERSGIEAEIFQLNVNTKTNKGKYL